MNKSLKKIKPLLFLLLIIASSASIFIGVSRASDQVITCDSGGCSAPGTALFIVDNAAPSESFKRTLQIKNQRGEILSVSLTAGKSGGTDESTLGKIDVKIDEVGGSNKYLGTLETLLSSSTVVHLGTIQSFSSKEFEFAVSLQDIYNDYQGKKANFDFSINVTGEVVEGGGGTTGVLGVADSNLGGKILGLAATGSDFFSNLAFWLGVILLILGIKLFVGSLQEPKNIRT